MQPGCFFVSISSLRFGATGVSPVLPALHWRHAYGTRQPLRELGLSVRQANGGQLPGQLCFGGQYGLHHGVDLSAFVWR